MLVLEILLLQGSRKHHKHRAKHHARQAPLKKSGSANFKLHRLQSNDQRQKQNCHNDHTRIRCKVIIAGHTYRRPPGQNVPRYQRVGAETHHIGIGKPEYQRRGTLDPVCRPKPSGDAQKNPREQFKQYNVKKLRPWSYLRKRIVCVKFQQIKKCGGRNQCHSSPHHILCIF